MWGLRLSHYIFWRNRGKGEDYRYRRWREEAGAAWWWHSYFKVFLLQGVVMWLVAAPVVAVIAASAQAALGWVDALGVVVWAVGFFFEAVGDWQLARFKTDPANTGRLFTGGVWRYTRHPNYFGDAAVWWGHFSWRRPPGAWWTLFSPALMTFLLVRVSGVSMLEPALRDSKPGYREYIESTSAFFPLPPRRHADAGPAASTPHEQGQAPPPEPPRVCRKCVTGLVRSARPRPRNPTGHAVSAKCSAPHPQDLHRGLAPVGTGNRGLPPSGGTAMRDR